VKRILAGLALASLANAFEPSDDLEKPPTFGDPDEAVPPTASGDGVEPEEAIPPTASGDGVVPEEAIPPTANGDGELDENDGPKEEKEEAESDDDDDDEEETPKEQDEEAESDDEVKTPRPTIPEFLKYDLAMENIDWFVRSRQVAIVNAFSDNTSTEFVSVHSKLFSVEMNLSGYLAGVTPLENYTFDLGDISAVDHPGILDFLNVTDTPATVLFIRGRQIEYLDESLQVPDLVDKIKEAHSVTFHDQYPQSFHDWRVEFDIWFYQHDEKTQFYLDIGSRLACGGLLYLFLSGVMLACESRFTRLVYGKKTVESPSTESDGTEKANIDNTEGDTSEASLRRRAKDIKCES